MGHRAQDRHGSEGMAGVAHFPLPLSHIKHRTSGHGKRQKGKDQFNSVVQVAQPGRTEEYQQLKETLENMVHQINSTYSTPTWTPVHLIQVSKLVVSYFIQLPHLTSSREPSQTRTWPGSTATPTWRWSLRSGTA